MKQATALSLLKTGNNVFLTGSAGTGKTYVLQQYIAYLRARKIRVAITASTGIAASHLHGMTIHAWAGLGMRQSWSSTDLEKANNKKYLRDKLLEAQVLIIDEISMLHKQQLDMVNQVLKYVRGNQEAFGGVQVVFCGDFFQLPPVGNRGESNREKFAFMSSAWLDARPLICYLTEQYRQNDQQLNQILQEIRQGQVSAASQQALRLAAQHSPSVHQPPVLYTHNHDVNRTNNDFLRKLPGKMQSFQANTNGNKRLADLLKNSVLADETLYLKTAAKVMFVKNSYEKGYVNGSLGTVKGFDAEGFPIVELSDGRQLTANMEVWEIFDDKGKALASFEQVPLRLAWAITVHKSQGMTLDAAKIDLSRTFEPGQGYVALSRVRSFSGIQLLGFNQRALEIDGLAQKADRRFQELSTQAAQAIPLADQEQLAVAFIKRCGGLTDPEAIKKQQKKQKEKRKKKKATHLMTKDLIDQGMNLKEIAEERGLTPSTIIGHLDKLYKADPQLNIDRFRPDPALFHQIQQAHQLLQKSQDASVKRPDGSISSKALFEELGQQVDYATLKLALLFL